MPPVRPLILLAAKKMGGLTGGMDLGGLGLPGF